MKVERHEGLHRFLVESGGSDPAMAGGSYLVDLAANHGIGFCGCRRWECKIAPRIRKGELPTDLSDELFTCAHIRAARAFQYDLWFWRLMEDEPPENL
jgi:hypothetical protein